jgi:hypothetical protein
MINIPPRETGIPIIPKGTFMGIIDQAWEKRLVENSDGGMPVQELAKGVLEMGKLAYSMGWQDCARRAADR